MDKEEKAEFIGINISDHIHIKFREMVEAFSCTYSLSDEDRFKLMNCLTKFYEKELKENKNENRN